jgi:hypothetical protein
MRPKIWLGAALLVVVGFLLGWSLHPAPAVAPGIGVAGLNVGVTTTPVEKAKTVSVMLDYGDGTIKTWDDVDISKSANLFEVLKTLSAGSDGFALDAKPPGEYGVMIDRIGDKKNGDEGGKYWLFYVNGKMGEKSSDNTELKPGDVVEWKFVKLKM